jgi:hypothetical protein
MHAFAVVKEARMANGIHTGAILGLKGCHLGACSGKVSQWLGGLHEGISYAQDTIEEWRIKANPSRSLMDD